MSQEILELLKIIGIVFGLMSPITAWVWNISSRVQRLETKSTHYPTNKDIHKLQLSIESLSGEVKTLSAELKSERNAVRRVEKILERQQDYLMQKEK